MKDNLILLGKMAGAFMGILTLIGFLGEPFLEDYVDARVDAKLQDESTISRVLTNSKTIVEYTTKVEEKAIKNVIKRDSTKVGLRSIIGLKTGIRDEFVSDSISAMLNDRKTKSFVTDEQCILNSKKYGRGRNAAIF